MVETKRLAIVGASVRAAAQSAVRAGFDVVAADLFADVDLAAVCPATRIADYPEGITAWLRQQSVDGWLYTGALENYGVVVAECAEVHPLLGVSGLALTDARNPLLLQELFSKADVRFPETVSPTDTPPDNGAWLAKAPNSASGSGVARLVSDEDWRLARDQHRYAQRFVSGEPMSALYAVNKHGGVLLGLTEQLIGGLSYTAQEFAYRGSLGPIVPSRAVAQQLERIGGVLSEQLRLTGLVGVDLVVDGDTLFVIEINPRYTASAEVLEHATGRSAIETHVAACRGFAVDPWSLSTQRIHGKRILYAHRTVTASCRFIAWATHENREGRLADLAQVGEVFTAGHPVCTLLASGVSRDQVCDRLDRAEADADQVLFEQSNATGTTACESV